MFKPVTLTISDDKKSSDNPEQNPGIPQEGEQGAQRQSAAGERLLTQVIQEKNKLQDANTQLGEELKDVRVQLSNSVKENRRLRRGIYSKCLSKLF